MSGDTDRERQIGYVRRWKELGPVLDRIRHEEIRNAETAASIASFAEAFRIALRDLPPRETSGLVEWQAAAKRWWRRYLQQLAELKDDPNMGRRLAEIRQADAK